MLNKKVEEKLNQQVAIEAMASQKYLAMACWCDNVALEGCANFFYNHAEEERMHMLKLVRYINESGGFAIIPSIEQPRLAYNNILEVFEFAYTGERKVSAAIDSLVEVCIEEKDKQTVNFLQWFLDEQHEEETLYRSLLDRIKLIGVEGRGLYFIDKEVQAIKEQAAEKASSQV